MYQYTVGNIETKPCYDHYQNTGATTKTRIEFDLKNDEVTVVQDQQTNSTSDAIWNNRTRVIDLGCTYPEEKELRSYLTDNALITEVFKGSSIRWDGSNKGELDDDAANAFASLEHELETMAWNNEYTWWDIADWCNGAEPTAENLDELVKHFDPDDEYIVLSGDIRE